MPEQVNESKITWQDPDIHFIQDDSLYEAIRTVFKTCPPDSNVIVSTMCLEKKLASALFEGTRLALKAGRQVDWIVPEWHKYHEGVGQIEREGAKVQYVPKEFVQNMNPPGRESNHWQTVIVTKHSAVYIPPHAPYVHHVHSGQQQKDMRQVLKAYDLLKQINPAAELRVHTEITDDAARDIAAVFAEGPVDARTRLDNPELVGLLLNLTRQAVLRGVQVSYKVPEAKRDHPAVAELLELRVPVEYVPQHLVAEVIP